MLCLTVSAGTGLFIHLGTFSTCRSDIQRVVNREAMSDRD